MGVIVNNRLESFTRGTDLLPGLHARVHDALWLLARQWQLGERDGSDAGSPVAATLVTQYAPLARWQPGGGAPAPYDRTVPLEALVESDGGALSWRDKVAGGLRLARGLRRVGVDPAPLLALHGLQVPDAAAAPDLDPATHATSAVTPDEVASIGVVVAGRVLDPDAIAKAHDADADAVVAVVGEPARAVLASWRDWWRARQPRAVGAWQPAELGYALSAATDVPGAPVYRAPRFAGGALDWYAFDVAPAAGDPLAPPAPPPASTRPVPETITTRLVPVSVRFHGAPVGRYWQLDDARTDLGAIETYPTELGKLLLAEITTCFGDDWFRLPVRVPYGSAARVQALVSTDTFGVATLVPAASSATGARPWKMYEHSVADDAGPADGSWLLVPPVLSSSLNSQPAESVSFVRDAAADLVWAVEDVVTNAVGRPVRRADDLAAQGRLPPPDPRDSLPNTLLWRLATSVPENWIPFLPTRGRAVGDDYALVPGAMIRYVRQPDTTLKAIPILPAGLALRAAVALPEREVPREGVSIRRIQRLARWTDGSRARWWSWVRSVGHGEASSGLAYDGLHTTSADKKALAQ